MRGPTGRGRNSVSGSMIQEDSYEPAPLDKAWSEYRDQNPQRNNPDGFAAFRAGYRRGVAQGALLGASTFVHSAPESPDTEQGA